MEFRCQHCGHRIVLNPPPGAHEVECPSCGVVVKFPHPPPGAPDSRRAAPDEGLPTSQRMLRRIFEPIPRPFAYLVGAALVLMVLAPFWVYLLKERFDRQPPVLSDDASSIPVPPAAETNPSPPMLEEPRTESTSAINEFRGIRLNTNLEGLQRRFNVRLQNTRGMVPEIYGAMRVGDMDKVTMHFYNNLLKEFWVDTRERQIAPEEIEKKLRERFGEPRDRLLRSAGQRDESLGLGLPGAAGAIKAGPGQEKRLAGFPYRVEMAWADDETLAEATIYYTSATPTTCSSLLTMHISAVRWLDSNRPQIGPVAAPASASATNTLDQTNAAPAPPKRLFP
jgi:hypothetical protein